MNTTISMCVINPLPIFALQLFADGGGAGASSAGAGAGVGTGATAPTGETSSTPTPVGENTNKQDNNTTTVVYGKQDNTTSNNTIANNSVQEQAKIPFADLVKSDDYKEDFQKFMDKAFQKRFKDNENLKSENARMREILDLTNVRYGLDSSSDNYLDELTAKIQGDTKLYEDEALEAGVPVEEYMKIKNAERIIESNKREQADKERQAFIQAHCQNLVQQSETMKQQFPNFNLESEMDNPQFRKLVDPPELGGTGLSVENAYRVIHYKDILNATVSNAVNQTAINTANAVKTNKERPRENGMNHRATVVVKDDPSQFTMDDFKRIKEQYLRTGVRPKF